MTKHFEHLAKFMNVCSARIGDGQEVPYTIFVLKSLEILFLNSFIKFIHLIISVIYYRLKLVIYYCAHYLFNC